ncbi:MAG: DoxX family protein [Chitinophagales bacterium]
MKKYAVYLMGVLYIAAGANHFINQPFYTKMMPLGFPFPIEMVYVSGVAEMLLGLGLFLPFTRKISSAGIILLLIAVFPANVNMAMHYTQWSSGSSLPFLLRLPLQLPLIWWAYTYFKNPQLTES